METHLLNKNALLACVLASFALPGCNAQTDSSQQDSTGQAEGTVIVGSLDWREITTLPTNGPERVNGRAVGHMTIPEENGLCTGFLVATNIVMTNHHCVPTSASARDVTVTFNRTQGTDSSTWTQVRCDEFIGNNRTLDYALLRCQGSPGDTFGVVQLSDEAPIQNQDIYVVHQNCDYYTTADCEPNQKYSPGRVTRVDTEIGHNADTLGGSSGSPLFSRASHQVIGLHHVGLGGNALGRGVENTAIPIAAVVSHIERNFPEVRLGTTGGETPTPGADEGDTLEPNDTLSQATRATTLPFEFSALEISSASDNDVIELNLDRSMSVRFRIRFSHASGDLDIQLLDAVGDRITQSETTTNEELIERTLPAGRYYLHVYGYSGAMNEYSLSISSLTSSGTSSSDPYEPNNSLSTARSVVLPFTTSSNATIASPTDRDYFSFTTQVRKSISLSLNFNPSQQDLDLMLIDGRGNVIAKSESADRNERITMTVPAGTYRVQVLGYNGAVGNYSLSIR